MPRTSALRCLIGLALLGSLMLPAESQAGLRSEVKPVPVEAHMEITSQPRQVGDPISVTLTFHFTSMPTIQPGMDSVWQAGFFISGPSLIDRYLRSELHPILVGITESYSVSLPADSAGNYLINAWVSASTDLNAQLPAEPYGRYFQYSSMVAEETIKVGAIKYSPRVWRKMGDATAMITEIPFDSMRLPFPGTVSLDKTDKTTSRDFSYVPPEPPITWELTVEPSTPSLGQLVSMSVSLIFNDTITVGQWEASWSAAVSIYRPDGSISHLHSVRRPIVVGSNEVYSLSEVFQFPGIYSIAASVRAGAEPAELGTASEEDPVYLYHSKIRQIQVTIPIATPPETGWHQLNKSPALVEPITNQRPPMGGSRRPQLTDHP